jgi:hypothetical protein
MKATVRFGGQFRNHHRMVTYPPSMVQVDRIWCSWWALRNGVPSGGAGISSRSALRRLPSPFRHDNMWLSNRTLLDGHTAAYAIFPLKCSGCLSRESLPCSNEQIAMPGLRSHHRFARGLWRAPRSNQK